MEVKICTNEVLLGLLFKLMDTQYRRCVTAREIERTQKYVAEEAKKQDIDVLYTYDMSYRLEVIRKYIDIIIIDGEVVYRLKPTVTIEEFNELKTLLLFYQSGHKDIAIEKGEEFLLTLRDYTNTSEKYSEDFRRADERHQLGITYRLFQLEKEERELKRHLEMMALNGVAEVNSLASQALLVKNPDMTKDEFIEGMRRI